MFEGRSPGAERTAPPAGAARELTSERGLFWYARGAPRSETGKKRLNPALLGRSPPTKALFVAWCALSVAMAAAALLLGTRRDGGSSLVPACYFVVCLEQISAFSAARAVRRGQVARVMYVGDWLSIAILTLGAALAFADHLDETHMTDVALSILAVLWVGKAVWRRRLAARLARVGGVERVFE